MILDETDSGLDIDALKIVADGINAMRSPDNARPCWSPTTSACSTTCSPDFVHVLARGRIVKSGGPELAKELEEKGYGWLEAA